MTRYALSIGAQESQLPAAGDTLDEALNAAFEQARERGEAVTVLRVNESEPYTPLCVITSLASGDAS